MRTNIELDDQLVEKAFALTGIRTKKELVNFALKELIKSRSPKDLLDLAGQIEFTEGFSTDTVRANRYVVD
ncbi:type II toxin-antitoxin system VapB family antitoxin [Pleurocapsa sp. PCC 7319]|uniref:type II toxin-antitoxin system VapB family antitoxin n=1 Tax=Pleurocapsa sp. PCC 7319 TaxID=118161 RepID=UPI00034BD9B9|nr:type II toxin-antitoxin system VapB family antitoxin [Pleurocapsa sp. PCC 7319]